MILSTPPIRSVTPVRGRVLLLRVRTSVAEIAQVLDKAPLGHIEDPRFLEIVIQRTHRRTLSSGINPVEFADTSQMPLQHDTGDDASGAVKPISVELLRRLQFGIEEIRLNKACQVV